MPNLVTQRNGGNGERAAPATATWLSLAAAPTFALMAVLSAVQDDGVALCSLQHASPLTGMAAMYGLMSTFHLPPWIKLMAKWWRGSTAYRVEPPVSMC